MATRPRAVDFMQDVAPADRTIVKLVLSLAAAFAVIAPDRSKRSQGDGCGKQTIFH